MHRYRFVTLCLFAVVLSSCKSGGQPLSDAQSSSSVAPSWTVTWKPDWSQMPGSLVKVGMHSTVGVVLDDIPEGERGWFVAMLEQKPASFWQERARRQIRLMSLRLNFRNLSGKKQLPLPPETQWDIQIANSPERVTVNGHDVVRVPYVFSSLLLSDEASPGETEPALGKIGGVWTEDFVFPVDPEFIFQRTGFACMNESQFPPNSMDAEESDLFYDDRCKVEKTLTNTGCHQTKMPALSCVQAIDKSIGRVEAQIRFERLPWDAALADRVRIGDVTNADGPDLEPYKERFEQHRFTYRYIPANSCTIDEQCVGAPGWRHLLMFPTADLNVGSQTLEIGLVDYFQQHNGSVLSKHGLFEFSACHQHYHFSHYGSFTLGDGSEAITRKNGFCMQPTARLANNELSPLHHPYTDCLQQGVSVGWIDEYKMGLECQWVDVSDVQNNQTLPLSFTTNPEGLICEGNLQVDNKGEQLFQRTKFKTLNGDPVDEPVCERYAKWDANNTEAYDVRIPAEGESYVTQICREGLDGPLRNCGLRQSKVIVDCTPGSKVTLSCSVPAGSESQVVRFCEASKALGVGIPCTYNDALASTIVSVTKDVTFTCPTRRDPTETGGSYSYLTGALFADRSAATVTCVQK